MRIYSDESNTLIANSWCVVTYKSGIVKLPFDAVVIVNVFVNITGLIVLEAILCSAAVA